MSNNSVLRSLLNDEEAASYFPVPVGMSILDKERGMKQYVSYMLDRTNTMFEYTGLPDTIPAYMLELYLQIFGYAAFVEVKETNPLRAFQTVETPPGLYIFFGGVGGERDIYYRPKLFTAANPRLKGAVQSTILYKGDVLDNVERPCVLMANDRNYMGLLPLFNRYAQQLVENDISIRSAQINARAQVGIAVSTDRGKETARKYLDDLEAGKLGIIGEEGFLDGVQTSNLSTQSSNTIIQLIELQQYLKASWFNELGLNVNFNMKREYMSEEEIAVNTDILLPLVDDMLRARQEAIEVINELFGLNITVEKSSAWANKEREEVAALTQTEQEAGIVPEGGEGVGTEENGAQLPAEEIQSDVPQEVQSTRQPDVGDTGAEGVQGESGAQPEEQAEVNININVNVEGGDSDESSVSEPETLEESEESSS